MYMKTREWIQKNCEWAKKSIVSFDFDGTILNSHFDATTGKFVCTGLKKHIVDEMRRHYLSGKEVIIMTRRKAEKSEIEEDNNGLPTVRKVVKEYGLPVKKVYFTQGTLKGPWLKALGVELHYDDDPEEVQEAVRHGVETIFVEDD